MQPRYFWCRGAVRPPLRTMIWRKTQQQSQKIRLRKKRIREQAEKIVAGMTLEQKIAQMITISLRWWSDTPDDTDSFADATELNA